jgi:F-type H+-transporting ATPase subunit epsilon
MATEPTGGTLRCVVVTPEKALLDETVDFVALPMYDGELGVLPGRAPLVGRLGTGELRYRSGAETHHFYVDGGFVQVRSDVVTVLTPRALKPGEINVQSASQTIAAPPSAESKQSPEERLKAQQRARTQIRVARHAIGQEGHG